jgi:hypothetical protein
MNARRIPLDFFGMTSGPVGLAGTWLTMSGFDRAPTAIGDIVGTASAVVWLLAISSHRLFPPTTGRNRRPRQP